MDLFSVPVTGEKIPRGWFAHLVFFINSLRLRTSSNLFCVNHTEGGTTIEPTPALIQALERASAPVSGDITSGLTATVSGGTASVAVSGSSPLKIIPGSNIRLSGGTNGELIVSAESSLNYYPIWGDLGPATLQVDWGQPAGNVSQITPIVLDYSGYLYIQCGPTISLNQSNGYSDWFTCFVYVDGQEVACFFKHSTFTLPSGMTDFEQTESFDQTQMIPVHLGSTVTAYWETHANIQPNLGLTLYYDTIHI